VELGLGSVEKQSGAARDKEMRVYIANFGKGNWAWPNCKTRHAIAVMDDARVHPFWKSGDREGYINEAQRVLRLASGAQVIKPVASRWYNLNTILMETAGDLWIHREKDELWWTTSLDATPDVELIDDPKPHAGTLKIYVYYKPCSEWSNRSELGAPLRWGGLHPRAKEFLFTEGTFQQLSPDHASYAQALIAGKDLTAWHSLSKWNAKAEKAKRSPVKEFDSRERTIARMAMQSFATAAQSGDISVSAKKDKECRFRNKFEMEKYITELFQSQDGVCALTGIRMLFDDDDEDANLRCSLDRIDSAGHYERSNLQIVCRFANQWKSASDNDNFIRLIAMVRSAN
jgi:hypothetical protein